MKNHSDHRLNVWVTGLLLLLSLAGWAQTGEVKFVENKCQWPEPVQYMASVSGGAVVLSPASLSYILLDKSQVNAQHELAHEGSEVPTNAVSDWSIPGYRVDVALVNANKSSKPQPFGMRPEYYNYFLGNNNSHWSSGVHAYEGVMYPEIYAGVDLKVYSEGEHFKYEFTVAPGADISKVKLSYRGADEMLVHDGDLIGKASHFSFIEKKPYIYQEKNGERYAVKGEYALQGNSVSFKLLEAYDECYPLVIDPILIFSTYSGSTADNWGSTATPGEHGTLYSAGVTNHVLGGNFPVTAGSFQLTYGGGYDIGILKYDSAGTQLLYATYLGGSGSESPHSLVINKDNELLVLGTTDSNNFPTSLNAFDRTFNGGSSVNNVISYSNGSDLFVARISADGRTLIASTLLGGAFNDGLNPNGSALVVNYGDQLRGDIITDKDNNIYLSTVTSSPNFPVRNSFGLTYNGGDSDALLVKLNPDLSDIVWAAYVGGSFSDASHTIKFDPAGEILFAGGTNSSNFPVTAGAYQTTHAGGADGWIARVSHVGSAILHSTFTGTTSFNQVYFIDLDTEGNVYAYGQTSGTFPTTAGVYKNNNSGQFLQKFDANLSQLKFSTVFGAGRGIPDISPTAFLVNDCNNIYLSGWGGAINSELGFWSSSTTGMPVTSDAFQKTTSGSDFYFIVLSGDASQLLYATYLGGTKSKTHVDGGTSRFDKSGIVYHAVCAGCDALNSSGSPTSDFPTTPGAWSNLNRSANCNNAAFKFDLSLLKARIQTNSVALDQPGLNKICYPDKIVFQNKSTGGEIYEWTFGDGKSESKTDTSLIVYQYQQAGTYKVKLKVIDQGTCKGVDSTSTVITVFKSLGLAGPDHTMCFKAGVTLTATGGIDYKWTTADKSFASSQQNPNVNPQTDTRYFVSITDVNSCVRKDTVDVTVIPGIDLKFDFDKIYDCEGRPSLQVVNLTESDEQTFFDFGDGTTSDLKEVEHNYKTDNTYQVKLVGVKDICVYEVREQVPIFTLFVPNVITPDEFPENNVFQILYGNTSPSQVGLSVWLRIYNRWGKLVYENKEYQGDWNASNVESGVYFYEMDLAQETTCKGWVHVIK